MYNYKHSFQSSFALIILIFLLRLTELSVDCITESEAENVEKFLCSAPLKSLDYRRESKRASDESFLMQLLHSNSNLNHLKLRITDSWVFTKSLFEKLISSNLKSCFLDIVGTISVQDPDSFRSYFSAEDRPAALLNLTVSIFNESWDPERDIVAFLQCCQNIHYLQFHTMSPNILQSLLEHQVKILCFIKFTLFGRNLLFEKNSNAHNFCLMK